jgi:Ca-activated chloride channel family protein
MIDLLHPWVLVLAPVPWLLFWLDQASPYQSPLWTGWTARAFGGHLILPQRLFLLLNNLPSLAQRERQRQRFYRCLAVTGWLALILACAVPISPGQPLQLATGRDLLCAIDLSASMEARDVILNGQRVDRYTAVKTLAGDFINQRSGDRVGLIVFADDAFLLAPLTYDTQAIAGFLHEVTVGLAGQKTAMGNAIGLAVKTLREQPEAARVLILLSDGESNAGDLGLEQAASLARAHRITVHTIGFGQTNSQTNNKAGLPNGLQFIAEQSGGRYFEAKTVTELRQVYLELDRIEPTALDDEPPLAQRDWVTELLLIAFCCMAILTVLDYRELSS